MMYRDEMLLKVNPLIRDHLEKQGYCLVDSRFYKAQGRGPVLEVLADRPEGGITLDECARLNRELGGLLEARAALPEAYELDVSSPGLDRPLTTEADFRRCRGKEVRIFLKEEVAGKIETAGVIEDVTGESVILKTNENLIGIPLVKVNKAKQVIL